MALLRYAAPRSQVHFVNRDRSIQAVAIRAGRHPFLVMPLVVEIPDDRCRVRRYFTVKCEGVGLVGPIPVVTGFHMILIGIPMADIRNEAFPDAGLAPWVEVMAGSIPSIKRSDHGHSIGIR